jgi:hypothetical protein
LYQGTSLQLAEKCPFEEVLYQGTSLPLAEKCPFEEVLYQGTTSQLAEKCLFEEALYQGTSFKLAEKFRSRKSCIRARVYSCRKRLLSTAGFSPCRSARAKNHFSPGCSAAPMTIERIRCLNP